MSSYIDFEEVKRNTPITKAITLLQLDMREKGSQLRGACPACGGNDRTLVITPAKEAYYCFAAKKGGDVIALAAHVREIGMKDAAILLAGGTVPVPEGKSTSTVPGTVPQSGRGKETEKFQPLSYLEADHPAVEAVGLDPATARALGIGYAKKGILRGTVAVPIRLADGTLTGYIGITEATLPPTFHIPNTNVVPFGKKETA